MLTWSGAAFAAPQTLVTDARIGKHDDHTRFVLDVSQKVDFNVFTLADPYRVVVDFPEVGWRLDTAAAKSAVDWLMKGYRYGLYRPGRSRLVVDLSGPATLANKFLLPPEGQRQYRLVLDLVPTDRATYLKSAGWPATARALRPPLEDPAIDPAESKTAQCAARDRHRCGPWRCRSWGDRGDGTFEKDLVLSLAKEVRRALENTGKYKVVMTRDTDIFLSLKARVAVGRRARADLFVSIHADSAPGSEARGASVYTLSEKASDKEAEALAAENQSDVIAGVDLTNESDIVTSILIDLAQRETKNSSVKFAQALVPELQHVNNVTAKKPSFCRIYGLEGARRAFGSDRGWLSFQCPR